MAEVLARLAVDDDLTARSPARSTNAIPLDGPSAEALATARPRTMMARRWSPMAPSLPPAQP